MGISIGKGIRMIHACIHDTRRAKSVWQAGMDGRRFAQRMGEESSISAQEARVFFATGGWSHRYDLWANLIKNLMAERRAGNV